MSEQPNTLQHLFFGNIPPLKNESLLNTLWWFYVFSLIYNILGFWSWIMFMYNYSHIATRGRIAGMIEHPKAGSGKSFKQVSRLCSCCFPIQMAFSISMYLSKSSCLKVKLKSHFLEEVVLESFSTCNHSPFSEKRDKNGYFLSNSCVGSSPISSNIYTRTPWNRFYYLGLAKGNELTFPRSHS